MILKSLLLNLKGNSKEIQAINADNLIEFLKLLDAYKLWFC